MNHYHLYGLTLHATLACPELPPGGDAPDVIIRDGRAPAALANPKRQGVCFQATTEQVLLEIPGVARFLISAGREILIDREPGSDDASVRCLAMIIVPAILFDFRHLSGYKTRGCRRKPPLLFWVWPER